MKIITIVRTYNEQRNLKNFVNAYDWADMILIQDDWSEDIDYLFEVQSKRVLVSFYTGKRIERKTLTRAKQDVQVNSMIQWAEHLGADWIIMDDCDSIPNPALQKDARKIIETCNKDFVYVAKLHKYKDQGYFPEFSKPSGNGWEQCIWAWRAHKGTKCVDNGDNSQRFRQYKEERILRLNAPPYVCIHDPWYDDKIIEEKRDRYTEIYGQAYKNFDPLSFGGKLEQVPQWVYEK